MNELASKASQFPALAILKGSKTLGICLSWVMIFTKCYASSFKIVKTEEIIQEINELIENLRNLIEDKNIRFNDDVQQELSKILILTVRIKGLIIKSKNNENNLCNDKSILAIPNLKIAFESLCQNRNIILAKNIRRNIEFFVRESENYFTAFFVNNYKKFLYSFSTPNKVIIGLFIALPFHLIAPVMLGHLLEQSKPYVYDVFIQHQPSSLQLNWPENINSNQSIELPKKIISKQEINEKFILMLLSAIAGATGSVVSILSRLKEYDNQEYKETLLPFFIGAFKPMIGAFLGIFLFALLSSNLLPISISKENNSLIDKWFAVISLTFLMGFSERFANDIVSQTEKITS